MTHSLPLLTSTPEPPRPPRWSELLTELQALGLRWQDPEGTGLSRAGGAGPSDHKAIVIGDHTLMVPIATRAAARSPYVARVHASGETATLERSGVALTEIRFPRPPRFYSRTTADGIPYWKIATLHARDVLATTVLQTCTRYGNRATSCQFCAIGESLRHDRTVARKTPRQLAEVARAAVELDGVRQLVMTTGTPATDDRGARVLCEAASAVWAATALPIQAQCEPPADFVWFERMAQAQIRSLGMHLEAVSEPVRRRIMPGKAEVALSAYFEAFAAAVAVFGRGQVSSYVLAGLGDEAGEILEVAARLIEIGVYPFVVPFVPITGTPLERHPPPDPGFLGPLLDGVEALLRASGMKSGDMSAGCGRCGACSTLRAREVSRV